MEGKFRAAEDDEKKFIEIAKAFGAWEAKKVRDDTDVLAAEDFFPPKNGVSKNPQHLTPEEMGK